MDITGENCITVRRLRPHCALCVDVHFGVHSCGLNRIQPQAELVEGAGGSIRLRQAQPAFWHL